MKNEIIVNSIKNDGHKIKYYYSVAGEWTNVFNLNDEFFVEYSCDVSSVPDSIAIIPFLANLLPMAWICDAQINVPVCDRDFYYSIPKFKKGYIDMYPMMNFKGSVNAEKIEKNSLKKDNGSMAFFSGGVDAFNTLVCHADEHPTLITLWGADIKFEDEIGWNRVEKHLKDTAEEFNVDFVTVKSSFRKFLKEGALSKLVAQSGDGWWHGFQHGVGIISHSAPAAFAMGKSCIYFASSFTAAEKGKVTCASDPTIDNYIEFSNVRVFHDGYEFTRQMKIRNIINFSKKHKKNISLRVCWSSSGGSNCCNCEKCWRTVLGIYSEGEDPRKYGFDYTEDHFKKWAKIMKLSDDKMLSELRYGAIQEAIHKNRKLREIPKELRWFYKTDKNKLGKHPVISKINRIKSKLNSIIVKIREINNVKK